MVVYSRGHFDVANCCDGEHNIKPRNYVKLRAYQDKKKRHQNVVETKSGISISNYHFDLHPPLLLPIAWYYMIICIVYACALHTFHVDSSLLCLYCYAV